MQITFVLWSGGKKALGHTMRKFLCRQCFDTGAYMLG